MNKTRTQKRWNSEEEIIAAIDTSKAKQRALCASAEALACESKAFLDLSGNERLPESNRFAYREKSNEAHEKSEHEFAKADRIDSRLKTLGEKLAAMRTCPMAFLDDDAVV